MGLSIVLGFIFLGIVISCIGVIVYKRYKLIKNRQQPKLKLSVYLTYGIIGFVSFLLFIFIPFGIKQIDNGEIAVEKRYGVIVSTKSEGLTFINILTSKLEVYDLRTQEIKPEFETYTKDGQAVTVQLTIQFKIQPEYIKEINKTFGSLNSLTERIDTVGITSTKEAFSKYEALELIKSRAELTAEVFDGATLKFNAYYIDITQILISDISFTSAFEDMIENKKIQEQELEKAKITFEKALLEAENRVAIATQAAVEALARAEGEANALLLIARAEAESVQIKAIEYAKSLGINVLVVDGKETIDPSDPNISLLSAYLEYMTYLEKWDGKLPTYLSDSTGAVVVVPAP
jgi:regulator of protease activity HflC (stomatin/prohibitin superfamily)